MFINISSDRIYFLHDGEKNELPYGDMEVHIPDFLYTYFKHHHDAQKKVTVLNGPGSFTNIRIATLALNTYNTLHDFSVDFISIDKLQYYHALYTLGKLPQYGLLFIGQKKNYWLVDFLRIQLGSDVGIEKVHLEIDKEKILSVRNNLFLDEVVAEAKDIVQGVVGDNVIMIHPTEEFANEIAEKLAISSEKFLTANYMIEANIS